MLLFLLLSLILLFDFLNHFLISLDNKSSNIPAFFAVVDRTCIPANLIIDIRISAYRTDLN